MHGDHDCSISLNFVKHLWTPVAGGIQFLDLRLDVPKDLGESLQELKNLQDVALLAKRFHKVG